METGCKIKKLNKVTLNLGENIWIYNSAIVDTDRGQQSGPPKTFFLCHEQKNIRIILTFNLSYNLSH